MDFAIDEETDAVKAQDGENTVIGGMITTKVIKTTRTNSVMAFITIEDLYGTVEVIVFSRTYEKYRNLLTEDRKLFIRGKITVEEDKPGKVICQDIIPFEDVPKDIWIKFKDMPTYLEKKDVIDQIIVNCEGKDHLWIYCEHEKQRKRIPHIGANEQIIAKLIETVGKENIKVVETSID